MNDLNLVGLTEAAAVLTAKAAGRRVRVVKRDELHLEVTYDCSPTRLNLTVVDGVVTAVRMG
jgi:hypothetical protein